MTRIHSQKIRGRWGRFRESTRWLAPLVVALAGPWQGNAGAIHEGAVGSRMELASAPAVTITSQPTSQVLQKGDTAVFQVGATGYGLVYIWYCNGSPLSGKNGPTLELTNVQPDQVGIYYAQILDYAGRVAAETDRVRLTMPRPELVITSSPENQRVLLGTEAVFFVNATGAGPLNYQWLQNGRVIPGATAPRFVVPATLESNAGSYIVRVGTPDGAILSSTAELTYSIQASASITRGPTDQGVYLGGDARFEVTASGSGSLAYEWRHGPELIQGAVGPTLFLPQVQASDAGEYWVTVRGPDGGVANAFAVLSVYWLQMKSIPDLSVKQGTISGSIPLALLGDAFSLQQATLTASSSNPELIAPEDILFGGVGAERFMIIMAKPNTAGRARIVVTASDRSQSASTEFSLTVSGPNTPPVIAPPVVPASVVLGEVVTIPLRVDDNETGGAGLTLSVQLLASSAPGLVQVIGDGPERFLVVKPEGGAGSSVACLVTARDPAGAEAQQFVSIPVSGPPLTIIREGRELVISYPNSAPVGAMECRYGVSETEPWRSVGYMPSMSGNSRVVRIPIPIDNTFFRLRF